MIFFLILLVIGFLTFKFTFTVLMFIGSLFLSKTKDEIAFRDRLINEYEESRKIQAKKKQI